MLLIFVLSLVMLIAYWIISGVVKYRNNEKWLKECENICTNTKKLYNDFVSDLKGCLNVIPHFNFDESNWVKAATALVYDRIRYGFEYKVFEKGIDCYNRFSDEYLDMVSLAKHYKRNAFDYISHVQKNMVNWYSCDECIPRFFRLMPIFGTEPIYCYCPNISINSETKEISGIVFKHNKKYGKLSTISFYNYELTPMTRYEFETFFLPNRLNVMEFNDERAMMAYRKFLILEYSTSFFH